MVFQGIEEVKQTSMYCSFRSFNYGKTFLKPGSELKTFKIVLSACSTLGQLYNFELAHN